MPPREADPVEPLLPPADAAASASWSTGAIDAAALIDGNARIDLQTPFRATLFASDRGVLLQVEQVASPTERTRIELCSDEDDGIQAIRDALAARRPRSGATRIPPAHLERTLARLRAALAIHGHDGWQPPGAVASRALPTIDISPLTAAGLQVDATTTQLALRSEKRLRFSTRGWAAMAVAIIAFYLASFSPFVMITIAATAAVLGLAIGFRRGERTLALTAGELRSSARPDPIPRAEIAAFVPGSRIHRGVVVVANDGRPLGVVSGLDDGQAAPLAEALRQSWSLPPLPDPLDTGSADGAPDTPLTDDDRMALMAHLLATFRESSGLDPQSDPSALERVESAAETALTELGAGARARVNLPFLMADSRGPHHLDVEVDRSDLERVHGRARRAGAARDPNVPDWVPRLADLDIEPRLIGECLWLDDVCLSDEGQALVLPGPRPLPLARFHLRGAPRGIRIEGGRPPGPGAMSRLEPALREDGLLAAMRITLGVEGRPYGDLLSALRRVQTHLENA